MTAWTDFVRKWATENKVSFKEALKSAKMKDEYHKANPKKQKTTKSKKPKIAYKPQPLQQMKSPSGLAGQAQQSIAKEIQKEEKPLQVQVPTLKEALKQPIPTPSDDTTGLTPADLRNATQRIVKKGKRLTKPTQDVPSFIQTEQKRPAPKIVMESLEEGFPPMRNMRLSDLSDDNLDLGDDIGITIKEVQKSIDEDVEQITPTGKGIRFGEMKNLLKSSYQKKRQDVGDWKVDTALSRPEAQVYSKDGEAVVVHRGTHRLADWGTNIAMTLGITTDRMKRAREVQRKAESKYGKENITTLGHSLGAKLAEDYGAGTKQVATLNKPTLPLDVLRGKSVPEKQTDIKTSGDPVSILRGLQKGKKAVNISSKTYNPLLEHSTETLSRLPQEALVGGKVYENLEVFEYDDKMDTQEIWNMIDDIRARIDILIERRENLTEALDNAEKVSQETGRRLKPEWVKKVKDRINDIKQEIRELDSDLEELNVELVRRRTRRRPEQEEDEMYENQEETNINNINDDIEGTGLKEVLEILAPLGIGGLAGYNLYRVWDRYRNRVANMPPVPAEAHIVPVADVENQITGNGNFLSAPIAPTEPVNETPKEPVVNKAEEELNEKLNTLGMLEEELRPLLDKRIEVIFNLVDLRKEVKDIKSNNTTGLSGREILKKMNDLRKLEKFRNKLEDKIHYLRFNYKDIFQSLPSEQKLGRGLLSDSEDSEIMNIMENKSESEKSEKSKKKPVAVRAIKQKTPSVSSMSAKKPKQKLKTDAFNKKEKIGMPSPTSTLTQSGSDFSIINSSSDDNSSDTNGSGLGSDYKLQSVAFDRKKYTPASARKWLKENKHKAGKIDTTDTQLRFRQEDPKKVQKAGYTEFRTKELGDKGIQLILAYKK